MRTQLACPECFGGSPRHCERCNETGYISVVVPDGGIPADMLALHKTESRKGREIFAAIACAVVAVGLGVVMILRLFGVG